jgi:hypothetical protein
LNRERWSKTADRTTFEGLPAGAAATAAATGIAILPSPEDGGLLGRLDKAKEALKSGKGPAHLRLGFAKSKQAQRAATAAAEAAASHAAETAAEAAARAAGAAAEERAAALARMAALQRGELHSAPIFQKSGNTGLKEKKAKHPQLKTKEAAQTP